MGRRVGPTRPPDSPARRIGSYSADLSRFVAIDPVMCITQAILQVLFVVLLCRLPVYLSTASVVFQCIF